jgi:hypothetical protein
VLDVRDGAPKLVTERPLVSDHASKRHVSQRSSRHPSAFDLDPDLKKPVARVREVGVRDPALTAGCFHQCIDLRNHYIDI